MVTGIHAILGRTLAPVEYVEIHPVHSVGNPPPSSGWQLRGTSVHAHYTERAELDALAARQEGLGRLQATCAALIPIMKTKAWWQLAQDERRAIMERDSHHISLGMEYLPAISRRLYQCRELGEPFDFLTWFEYAPEHEAMFDDLVMRLRATREWDYVAREVDIRLMLTQPGL
jgi:chlorite dismutase